MDQLSMRLPDPATSAVTLQFNYQQNLLTSYIKGKTNFQDYRYFSQNIEIVDSDKKQAENFNCIICLQFACEPLSCQGCETGIICKTCFDQSQQKNKNNECPQCKQKKQFQPLNKIAKKWMNSLKVKCQNKTCKLYKKEISYEDYLKHYDECFSTKCFFECGKSFRDFEEVKLHFQNCPNNKVQCKNCDSFVLFQNMKRHDCKDQFLKQKQDFNILQSQLLQQQQQIDQLKRKIEEEKKINTQEQQEIILKCPRQHKLNFVISRQMPPGKCAKCDFCQDKPILNSFYCAICQYDLCLDCVGNYYNLKNVKCPNNHQIEHQTTQLWERDPCYVCSSRQVRAQSAYLKCKICDFQTCNTCVSKYVKSHKK